MSEVSLETESGRTSPEDLQMDCEEADKGKESLSEDLKQESANDSGGGKDTADVLYEININSDEENMEIREEDKGPPNKIVVSVASGGDEIKQHVETAETAEENGDSHSETKVTFRLILNKSTCFLPCSTLAYVAVVALICCGGGGGLFPV